jgi:2-methylcitrate dehydratase PrpD
MLKASGEPRSRDVASVYAAYLSDTPVDALPKDVIQATKRSIFDTLGVMLAGSGPDAAAHRLVTEVARWGGVPEASVIGHPMRLPAVHAGFVNGAMAHQYDFDDTHDAAVAHPTANTLAAGLASPKAWVT